MWGKLEHAVKDERAALEENVAPVPAVVLHDVVRFGLYPKIEGNQSDAAEPPAQMRKVKCLRCYRSQFTHLRTCTGKERPSGILKQLKANIQYERKSLGKPSIRTSLHEKH